VTPFSLRSHIAQKIRGMTQPPYEEDALNERYRDLADLLLMRALARDLGRVREACVEVFSLRGTHPWPPDFEPPKFWEGPFGRWAEDPGLSANTLEDAAAEARAFISEIAAAPAP